QTNTKSQISNHSGFLIWYLFGICDLNFGIFSCALFFRSNLRLQWQLHGKGRSLSNDALDSDSSLVLLDDLTAHAQPQAASTMAMVIGVFRAVEGLKDEPQLVRWNAGSGVGDEDFRHLGRAVLANFNSQPSAARHGLTCIDDQVEQNLLDLPGHHGGAGPA